MDTLAQKGFALEQIEGRLALRDLNDEKMLPLMVDFLEPKLRHRLKHGLSKTQPLPKALGLKSFNPERAPSVIDCTAGLGTDAFIMAAMGCRVRGIERSATVFALLEDGYARLAKDEALQPLAQRLSFENANAVERLGQIDTKPDVIYLDPMYPHEGHSESALPKKAMQMFRRLIGEDMDADALFLVARETARERVVVKRPLKAPPLAGQRPTHVFEGKTARFDMYLCR